MTEKNLDSNVNPETPNASSEGARDEQPPSWFLQFRDDVEGRLSKIGKDFGRVREKVRLDDGAETERAATAPKSSGADDFGTALKLSRMIAKMSDEGSAEIESMIANGASPAECIRAAELINKFSSGSRDVTPKPRETERVSRPTGVAATAASKSVPAHPTTWKELLALKSQDPRAYQKVWDDPNFDPETLSKK